MSCPGTCNCSGTMNGGVSLGPYPVRTTNWTFIIGAILVLAIGFFLVFG